MTLPDTVRQELADTLNAYGVGWSTAPRLADALLPVVERIARRYAADELRGSGVLAGVGTPVGSRLIARADALTAEAQP